jgi:hypothetical protein
MSQRVLTTASACTALALLLVITWHAFASASAPPAAAHDATKDMEARGPAIAVERTRVSAGDRLDRTVPPLPPPFVRIVDENGAPVGGALVRCDGAADLLAAHLPLPFDVEARLAPAPLATSAADGTAALPIEAATAFVVARAGERFGCGVLAFDDPLLGLPELRVAPDRNLHLVVTGPHGEPRANVPIEVAFAQREGRVDDGLTKRRLPFSDREGVVMLWHAQSLEFRAGAEPAVELRPVVLGAEPPPVRVCLAQAGDERIVVPCPAHGRIRVRAWVAPGVPNQATVHPTMDADSEEWALIAPGASAAEWLVCPVALGLRPTLAPGNWNGAECEGPVHDGQEVFVDLLPPSGYQPIRVRLLRSDGRPCAKQQIEIDPGTPLGTSGAQVTTDSDGQACFVYSVESQIVNGHIMVLHAPALDAWAQIETPAEPSAPDAVLDLGAVRLLAHAPLPLLASGLVIDAATGRPVRGQVDGLEASGRSDTQWAGIDGAFELRGEGTIREIQASAAGYETAKIVNPGARGIVLALRRKPQLHVTVLVDPDISVQALAVRLRDEDCLVPPSRTITQPGQVTCVFTLWEAPALYLQVDGGWFGGNDRLRDYSEQDGPPPLAEVERHAWRKAGEDYHAEVDLRDRLDQIAVAITGPHSDGALHVRAAGTTSPRARLPLAPRVLLAVPRGGSIDALAFPSGGCARAATLTPGENTIAIGEPMQVQVEVQAPPATPASIGVHALQEFPFENPALPCPQTLEELTTVPAVWDYDIVLRAEVEDGRASVRLNSPGTYLLVPYVGARSVPLLESAVAVHVATAGEVVRATIRLDSEKVRALLR